MTTRSAEPTTDTVDLTECDRERLHHIGQVQSFGCLLAVSSDWTVQHASTNCDEILGRGSDQIIGQPLAEWAGSQALHDIRSRLQLLRHADSVERVFSVELIEGQDARYDVAAYRSGPFFVLEIEPSSVTPYRDSGGQVRPLIDRMRDVEGVDKLCRLASQHVRALTGFDRVMVYRFAPDDSGSVIAECLSSGLEPYLGLHYPASDIPQQARALYRRNLLRIISDVDGEVHPIVPQQSAGGSPLDLSMSGIRAVSPVHLEYLRNMGVAASMSISLIVRGKLWGLIACHHGTPRVLTYDVRTACELYGQMFGFVLEQEEAEVQRRDAERARAVHDELMARMAEGASLTDEFDVVAEALGRVIQFDGIAAWVDGTLETIGETPPDDALIELAGFLAGKSTSSVFATDHLPGDFPPAQAYGDALPGLLALPVSRRPRDFIMVFRREVSRSVKWAGNPDKAVRPASEGQRLSPRRSFAIWQQDLQHHSSPWTADELLAADALRTTLLEVVLRLNDAAREAGERARARQEVLIAELNHRVRNILGLIRGLMSQSRGDATDIGEYTAILDGRIQALARAHDQITRKDWAPASLHRLIETELAAYFGDGTGRAEILGEDVLVEPVAFTTLSLVFHELATNAAKYGALGENSGQLTVSIARDGEGDVRLLWKESDGPPVSPPSRRGFGTTIIERSIPVDLKGEADIRFEPTGLVAEFCVPWQHVRSSTQPAPVRPTPDPAPSPSNSAALRVSGDILIVEDNMIIALDAEMIWTRLGARQVHTAADVDSALLLIDQYEIEFAMLDVNLGDQTSAEIAERLDRDGVPFMFATGYGESAGVTQSFPKAPVVQKPYDHRAVELALGRSEPPHQ
ncbi:HWE histidine kinase domain-containing protein [Maricaulis sp. CAU 1757]